MGSEMCIRDSTYWENVKKSFMPEFISMNAMMAGMAPVMALLMMGRDMRAMDPTELVFWGVMSLGVAVGFAVAYPVNVWMVSRKMKHGLMTERRPEKKAEAQADVTMAPGHAPMHAHGSAPVSAATPAAQHTGHEQHAQPALDKSRDKSGHAQEGLSLIHI